MSTQTRQQPQPLPTRLWRGFRTWLMTLYRQTFRRGDFEALGIAFGMLVFPILALNTAGWTDGLLILLPISAIALLVSHLLARSGFSEGYALVLALLYGFASVITIHLIALPGDLSPAERLTEMTQRVRLWSEDLQVGQPGSENLVFAMALSILFWVLAHNIIWHVIRLDRVWRAIIPPGFLLVIVNLAYVGDDNLEIYMLGFLFFALLLVVHNYTRTREYEWRYQRLRYSKRIHRSFIYMGTIIAITVLLITQALPVSDGEDDWEQFEEFLGSDPIAAITDLWSRLFADLDGRGLATADYYGGDRLDLTGAVQLSDDPVMQISVAGVNPAGTRLYWRSTAFDTYDGRGWEHQRRLQASKNDEGMRFNPGDYTARQNITQQFEVLMRATSLVHAAAEPREIEDIVVQAELNCIDANTTNCVNQGQQVDLAIIRSRTPLRNGDAYTAVSSISIATAEQLRTAGTNYPTWVTDSYLQGSNFLSDRARAIAESVITSTGVNNPYDTAKALESYLRTIDYDETIPAPGFGQDPIDYFLFDIQRGYCTYYATTMVMMLRAQGIPARMASGFAEGEFQGGSQYLVKENDAHTWVEVFFPGYGWVNFEPTADESPVDRPGDPQFDDFDLETPEPTPSPTPPTNPTQDATNPVATPQPTLTPTVTPTPSPDPSQLAPAITSTPEFGPTQTMMPSPTPTLNPAPMVVSVDDNEGGGLFETLLMILLAIIVIITLGILGVLFAIWWVEHRGLGGLNPVQKAYARLAIYGRWLGISLSDKQTPHERRGVLVEAVPEGQESINTITDLYTQDRFGPPLPEPAQNQTAGVARSAWRVARGVFIRRKLRRNHPPQ